jgi:ABC-type sulfate transport system permease subunit
MFFTKTTALIAVDLAFSVSAVVVGVVVVVITPDVPTALESIFTREMYTFEVVVSIIVLSIGPKSGFLAN